MRAAIYNIFTFVLCISSFLFTLDFDYFLYIQSTTYIQLYTSLFFVVAGIYFLIRTSQKAVNVKIYLNDLVLLALSLYEFGRFLTSPKFNILIDSIIMIGVWAILYLFVKVFYKKKQISIFYLFPILGTVQIIYSLLQYFGILPVLLGFKIGGSFGNPGDLGNFLALTYSITLGLLFVEKSKLRKVLLGIILAFHLSLIIISLARTAWLATIFSSIFILAINLKYLPFWLKIKSTVITKKWLVPLMLFSIITFLVLGGWKIYELKSESANGRLFIWQLCLQLIAEKPLFGHGYESFITILRQAQINYFSLHSNDIKNGMLAANSVFAFNDFLQLAIEYGVVGGLLLLSLFMLPFKKIKFTEELDRKIITTIRGTFIALFTCALFSYPLQNQTILILFVILLAIVSSYDQDILFRFSLSPGIRVPILTVFIIGCLFLANFNYKKIVNGLKWEQAYELLQTDPQKGAVIYNSIYDFMKHDRSFISNYGLALFRNKEYQKLVDYYDEHGYFNPKSEIFLMVGESYEQLVNYTKAEEQYRMASNLIPHLFVPRYRLFKLYQKEGENGKALTEAQAISNLPIKVYSDIVKNIKTEVNEYLFNENTKLSQNETLQTDNQ